MKNLTFLILVKNIQSKSKNNFCKVIKQASKLSKNFYIVNNNSTDKTEQIIFDLEKKYNLNLRYFLDKNSEFDYLKYKYSKKIDTEYIFLLDDDEILTDKLIYELKNQIKKGYNLFNIKWHTYLVGKCVENVSYKSTLFKSTSNILSGNKGVHKLEDKEKIKAIRKEDQYYTRNEIKHYSYPSIDFLIDKSAKDYGKRHARFLYNKNKNISDFKLLILFICESIMYFFYNLFFLREFKRPIMVLYAFNAVVVRYYKYLYYIELKNQNLN